MYSVTFYSFKGGVGRTMALVNVAVELARKGRRVLVVDFDLEAPGLDTFDVLNTRDEVSGIVEYVSSYLDSGRAPNVEDFLFQSMKFEKEGGSIWVMPSGTHGNSYAATFAEIDWGSLYEKHDGFLLFEDLKAQWKETLDPDYVLIDSRTGHTDVGGICTRQLPDAVVALFFPNAQNLRGLTAVVRDIRSERVARPPKEIELHFVMSNVPDLDDEDKILEQNMRNFQKSLGFATEPLTIHRYDSLSLLNQVVFTNDRRSSRLAREYGAVAGEIMRLNPKDREGALQYISDAASRMRSTGMPLQTRREFDEHLKQIETNHRYHGEVMFRLGTWRAEEGRVDDARALYDSAIEAGHNEPDVFLQRATIRRSENDRHGASTDARRVLQSARVNSSQVRRALTMILPSEYEYASVSPAITSLSPEERAWIASDFNRSRDTAVIARQMLFPLLDDPAIDTDIRTHIRHEFIMVSIATGFFSDALKVTESEQPELTRMSIHYAFNFGMAQWGEKHSVARAPFAHVVALADENPRDDPGPNYFQCLALAQWAIGDNNAARIATEHARTALRATHGRPFSCWRYYHVTDDQFRLDLDDINRLIDGDTTMRPCFIEDNRTTESPNTVQLPDEWPTYNFPRDLWEELGRTVATFGFLEYVLKRAYLELTRPADQSNKHDNQAWETSLEMAASNTLKKITEKLSKVLLEDVDISQDEVIDIIGSVKNRADLRNALCHGTWTDYNHITGQATLQYFPKENPGDNQFTLSRSLLRRIRQETVETTCELVGAVKRKIPGFSGTIHSGGQ